ncbi:MAG: hypothetical protein COX07_03830 [Bacteroidetes bacterium CG23_combo_of_CG06-09_8_20_14_all_32_9]|nr:MAG: hypothetical protein COX07_03830 [Bacteroidetes bacterium CG23_combo_of_CG06-09_8_20_14_all_32_9]
MKTYQVVLSKNYVITVNAETSGEAKRVCEFYTGNIQDISTDVDRQKEKFEIENMECTLNETFECIEIETT